MPNAIHVVVNVVELVMVIDVVVFVGTFCCVAALLSDVVIFVSVHVVAD